MWQNIISACQSLGRWNAKEAVHPEGERWTRWSKTRQEALSMLRLILLIIYIYSCRHECDFEKSQKTGCHYLMEKSLDVAVVLVFVCLAVWLFCCCWRAGTCWFYPSRFGHLGAASASADASSAPPVDCLPLIAADVLQLCRLYRHRHRHPRRLLQIKLLPASIYMPANWQLLMF